MSENSWHENASSREPEYSSIDFSGLDLGETIALESDPEGDYFAPFDPSPLDDGFEGRRLKAAFLLTGTWGIMYLVHTLTIGLWLVCGLSSLMALHMLRAFTAKPTLQVPDSLVLRFDPSVPKVVPMVTLLVSAKNEESVIESLVRNLCNLDYPQDCYELWIVDDASTDRTSEILLSLRQEFPQLNLFRRPAGASGGKSGALNQVFAKTRGEFLVVFDADARIQPDFLQKTLPLFLNHDRIGAIQLRKAIAQAEIPGSPDAHNFWVKGQNAEMLLDAFMQQQRISVGGVGELRGNGQFVRRSALIECGGWNEETITDDLDLTFRLHLNHWDIHCLTTPAVYEEGVTTAKSLWHQRNRWGEGGYQRYLDYWRFIVRNRMGSRKTVDLAVFWVMQYFMPTAAVPDFLLAVKYHHGLMLTPLSLLTFTFFVASTTRGIRRQRLSERFSDGQKPYENLWDGWGLTTIAALQGFVYMMHWFAIVGTVTLRMAIFPKRLKWVKTIHTGH
jgi:1,2-diacylglycerol 3-beta-glucosyltransferase